MPKPLGLQSFQREHRESRVNFGAGVPRTTPVCPQTPPAGSGPQGTQGGDPPPGGADFGLCGGVKGGILRGSQTEDPTRLTPEGGRRISVFQCSFCFRFA